MMNFYREDNTAPQTGLTFPKTTCLPSNQEVTTVHRKNCEPLVLAPALACTVIHGGGTRWM